MWRKHVCRGFYHIYEFTYIDIWVMFGLMSANIAIFFIVKASRISDLHVQNVE